MAFSQRMIEQMAAWCFTSTELATKRKKAWRLFFGADDKRPIKYWGGAGDQTSRERRFLGWFMFDYVLPSGEKPGELAVNRLYVGSDRAEALKAVAGTRFVLAHIGSHIGRSVFLNLEDETFEMRSSDWAANVRPKQAILAHIVPVRQGYWLPGPGWVVWPFTFGPGIRSSLKTFQLDPISAERLIQGRFETEDGSQRNTPPHDDTLEQAVFRMTNLAKEKGYSGLVMPEDEWQSLVLNYITKREVSTFAGGFFQEIVKKAGELKSQEELQVLADLATNIWNNTPQPDRGGKSANQMTAR